MGSELLKGFYLRDLLVSPRKGQISGRSGLVYLPPNAMQVLVCLASHSGELVTREMLLETVWGEKSDGQEALEHAIREIRQALDDQSAEPRFLESVPERGYRLIVTPELQSETSSSAAPGGEKSIRADNIGLFENLQQRGVLEAAIAYLVVGWLLIQVADIVFEQLLLPPWAATFVTVLVIAGFPIAIILSWYLEFRDGRAIPHEQTPKSMLQSRFSRTYLSIVGAMAIAAVFVFLYDRNIGLPTAAVTTSGPDISASVLPTIPDNTIAVLPFYNVDGSEDTRIFANGLADDVITRLSRVPGLLVSSRGDSFTLEPNSASQKVRDRLRVARYLEGSVQLAGDRIRIIIQLIDSSSGFHLLSRTFDRAVEDFFDIRDEITELTVANVRVTLPPETQEASRLAGTDTNLDVYILYRRGMEQLLSFESMASLQIAIDWFDAALEVDSDYAAAHAGKCRAFVEAYQETRNENYIDKANTSCSRALALNANLDVVHTALGDLHLEIGEYAKAESSYRNALKIVPNSAEALTGLGSSYLRQRRSDAAEKLFRQATGLHPGDWNAYMALGTFLFRSGRYDEAVQEYTRAVAIDDTNARGYSNVGSANMLAGNFEAAIPWLKEAIALAPRPTTYTNLGLIYYYLGRLDESIEYHEKAIELIPQDHLPRSNLGDALWIAGRIDEAKKAFEAAEALVQNALRVNLNDAGNQMDLAWISAMLDKTDVARAHIDRALALAPDDPYVHYINGLVYLRHGKIEDALSALETAADKGYPLQIMAAEPHLAPIRGNPRFRAIVGHI